MAKIRAKIAQEAEDGDGVAIRAAADMHEEEGTEHARPLRVGDLITLFGIPYFFRGVIAAEDHEWIYLRPGGWKVYDTGPLASYFQTGKGKNEEVIPRPCQVRKACVEAIARM